MLSGVKVGKKKRKKSESGRSVARREREEPANERGDQTIATTNQEGSPTKNASDNDGNAQAAALLRQELLLSGSVKKDNVSPTATLPVHAAAVNHSSKPLEDMTVAELAAAEQLTSGSQASRREQGDVLRHYKHSSNKRKYVDSDDEEEDQMRAAGVGSRPPKKNSLDKQARRDEHRQQHALKQQSTQFQAALSKSWWWLESEKFRPQSLLVRGEHVSLVWAPPYCVDDMSTSTTKLPMHMFLVPISPATSFRQCEDETTWREVHQLCASLRKLYQRHNLSIIVAEAALSEGASSSKNYWQAKMHVLILPEELAADLNMYVRQTLSEYGYERHEWIATDTVTKPLTRAIPKGFPYLWYDDNGHGGVQSVEHNNPDSKKRVSHTFWTDLVAGVQSTMTTKGTKGHNAELERVQVEAFAKEWNAHSDWATK